MDGTMNRERIQRFGKLVFLTYGLSIGELVHIVRATTRYSTQYRAAALRNLACSAPTSVTGGRPYADRRRRVRQHYGI
jgi:hypothetical protein